ncbi:MAG: Uma2 family endonuclease [Cyanobacteria bacterium J06650_10]
MTSLIYAMIMLSAPVSELDLDISPGQITQTIVLSDISWQTYRAMLAEMGDRRSARVAYDQGTLIIKMPSKLHEVINRLFSRIVAALTEEFDLEIVDIGSTTLEKESLEKGAEPDTGFYIQNADKVDILDPKMPADLPPDLVLEVDITSASTRKMSIYQTLGVAELWRYTQRDGITIYHLGPGGYCEDSSSRAFPSLTVEKLNEFLEQHRRQGANQVIRHVRDWARSVDSVK